MKFNITDLSGFSDIGTIVYYPERSFYPELSPSDNSLLTQGISSGVLYSTSLTSEYVDFAKSGFTFSSPPISDLLPNLYEYRGLQGICELSEVDDLVSVSLPTAIPTEGTGKHFFGHLTSPSESVFLAHLPKGTWKVEVYNSRVTGNCGDIFIDNDILEKLGITPVEAPVLTIYFGPSYDVRIQDHTYQEIMSGSFPLYLDRYTQSGEVVIEEDEYTSFPKVMSKQEYIESYREEVCSEKILYLVNTPNGLETINFFPIAYPESKDPHPHMSEMALRNDTLWESRPGITKSPLPGMILDSRSGVLLGLKTLLPTESTWIRGAQKKFSESGRSTVAKVNGKTWKKAVPNDVFGEDPELSPFWYSLEDLPGSVFRHYYVVSTGKGKITPSGLVYLGPSHPLGLEIVPSRGYVFGGFSNVWDKEITDSGDGKILLDTSGYPGGYRFEAVFKEIQYSLNLQLDCIKDYPGNGGQKNTYNLAEIGSPEGTNFTPLSRTDIKLIYLSPEGMEVEYGSNHNRINPLKVTDTSELRFRLDTSESPYALSGSLYYGNGKKIKKSGDWYVLRVSDFPEETGDYIIPVGELISKKYTVLIKSTSGIQISTPKKTTMEYHNIDPNSPNPVPRPYRTQMILGPDNTIEVWQDGLKVDKGDGVWTLTEGKKGVWTFEIPYIQNNYEIIIR